MVKEIVEYTKELKPITDFERLKVGDKIFSIHKVIPNAFANGIEGAGLHPLTIKKLIA